MVAAILLLMRMLTRSLLTYMVAKLMITCTTHVTSRHSHLGHLGVGGEDAGVQGVDVSPVHGCHCKPAEQNVCQKMSMCGSVYTVYQMNADNADCMTSVSTDDCLW